MKKLSVLLVLIICIVLGGCSSAAESKITEHVYSHRGASGEEVEHTLAAYDLAVLYGSKYIEQDVVVSKDGTLYVSHDKSAKRITGVDSQYEDMTDIEIEELRTESGEKILKLKDVFQRYGDTVNYVVELKSGGIAVEKFVQLVNECDVADRVIVQCFNVEVLEELEGIYPSMPKLLLVNNQEKFEAGVKNVCVDIISVSKDLMSAENIEFARENAKKFNVYTLNSSEEILKAIELGVDSYFTDYTAKAIALEMEYR